MYNWRDRPIDCVVPGGLCDQLTWSARTEQPFFDDPAPTDPNYQGDSAWAGTPMGNGKDGSGLIYKRNRYYDPTTGRFTQVDPIGLGGGLNAYGFAGGDPVNYSDPFGLCPWCWIVEGFERIGRGEDGSGVSLPHEETTVVGATVSYGPASLSVNSADGVMQQSLVAPGETNLAITFDIGAKTGPSTKVAEGLSITASGDGVGLTVSHDKVMVNIGPMKPGGSLSVDVPPAVSPAPARAPSVVAPADQTRVAPRTPLPPTVRPAPDNPVP